MTSDCSSIDGVGGDGSVVGAVDGDGHGRSDGIMILWCLDKHLWR